MDRWRGKNGFLGRKLTRETKSGIFRILVMIPMGRNWLCKPEHMCVCVCVSVHSFSLCFWDISLALNSFYLSPFSKSRDCRPSPPHSAVRHWLNMGKKTTLGVRLWSWNFRSSAPHPAVRHWTRKQRDHWMSDSQELWVIRNFLTIS